MLSDRQYMRDEYSRHSTSILTWILCALVAGFVVQNVFAVWISNYDFARIFALTPYGVFHGFVWTFLTYVLLHGSPIHLLVNGLGFYFLGRELLPLLGSRRFLSLCIASAAAGGLFWFGTHFRDGAMALVGASSMVVALLIVFAGFFAEREVTFLLFFVIPVTLKPKVIAWVVVGLDVFGYLFAELPRNGFDTGIAHSAHLGGMLAGWIYYRYIHASRGWDRASAIELPRWLRRSKPTTKSTRYKVNVGQQSDDLRADVDRILDKINSQGFGALTEDEKRLLDRAKDMLSRH